MHKFSTAATSPSSERSEEIIRIAEPVRNVGGTSGAEQLDSQILFGFGT